MIKYYTRACNFIYGSRAKFLLKKSMDINVSKISVLGLEKNKNLIETKFNSFFPTIIPNFNYTF